MVSQESRSETLKRNGWTKQFAANEPRLSEAVALYEESGFEVHLEPLPPVLETPDFPQEQFDGECRGCFKGFEDQYKIIFTRPNKDGSGQDNELF
ncbi:MAG: hypothetical protein SV775_05620 [Thermodesulfobacteriota bacterium]|nr:hypothetical protein [Thermodesulfobacteriota bacterium]